MQVSDVKQHVINSISDALKALDKTEDVKRVMEELLNIVLGVRPYMIIEPEQLVEVWEKVASDEHVRDVLLKATTNFVWAMNFSNFSGSALPYNDIISTTSNYDRLIASLTQSFCIHAYAPHATAVDKEILERLSGFHNSGNVTSGEKEIPEITRVLNIYKSNAWFTYLMCIYVLGPENIIGDPTYAGQYPNRS